MTAKTASGKMAAENSLRTTQRAISEVSRLNNSERVDMLFSAIERIEGRLDRIADRVDTHGAEMFGVTDVREFRNVLKNARNRVQSFKSAVADYRFDPCGHTYRRVDSKRLRALGALRSLSSELVSEAQF